MTGEAAEFLAVAGDYLRADSARNTVMLTVTAAMRANPARYGKPGAEPDDPARSPLRMVRVGPVYTPPELRGHGYASAVTAAVSRQALDAGAAQVLLFTDLANPVSNAIYQRIGYRPVEDRTVLAFSAGA
jgi:GNAT superfamily N-acetyltransferase